MSLGLKVFPLLALMAIGASANVITYSISGPWSSSDGTCLSAFQTGCIDGSPYDYDITSATLAIDTVSNQVQLTVETDYPGNHDASSIVGGVSGGPGFVGLTTYTDGYHGDPYGPYNIGDLLMFAGPQPSPTLIGGIALSNHETVAGSTSSEVTAGDLYLNSSALITSCTALGETPCPLEFNGPVWLGSTNGQTGTAGTESVTVNAGGNGITIPWFTVTDTLTAPASFLALLEADQSQSLTFEISSFMCDNGTALGTGVMGMSSVPEPRNLLFVPALLIAALLIRRRFVSVHA